MNGSSKAFIRAHPLLLFIYFVSNLILLMILRQPLIIVCQTIALIFLTRDFKKYYLLILLLITLSNPLFVHRGETILLEVYEIVFTLEALIYGFISGLMVINLLILFSLMNEVLDSEHYCYLFAKYFPHISILISMTSQLIPRFIRQYSVIYSSQKQFYSGNRVKHLLNTFSIEATWAFESSIDMLDSMNARGYGDRNRTFYHLFRIRDKDVVYIVIIILLFVIGIIGYFQRYKSFYYYPIIIFKPFDIIDYCYLLAYVFIIMFPIIWEVIENDYS